MLQSLSKVIKPVLSRFKWESNPGLSDSKTHALNYCALLSSEWIANSPPFQIKSASSCFCTFSVWVAFEPENC